MRQSSRSNIPQQRYQWAVIVETDDNGEEVCGHVMPVDTQVTFDTKAEAQAFHDRLAAYDDRPCITDEDGGVTSVYFGHTVSKDCVCGPESIPTENPLPLYEHKMYQ